MIAEIRCKLPHPDARGLPCNGLIAEASPSDFSVRTGQDVPSGCMRLRCRRCKVAYIACPTQSAA